MAGNSVGGGDGGPGYGCAITGTLTYYAGGGGGSRAFEAGLGNSYSGTGGIGGGGNAGQTAGAAGSAGTPNTGGGGGGGTNIPSNNGGAGGSGIVIIRYITNVSATSWNSTQYLTSSVQVFGQSNAFLSSLGNSLLLTGVQLEKGSTATPYEYKPLATELQAAQRYYETSYDAGTPAGTATTNGAFGWSIVASNRPSYYLPYKTPKRTAATPTLYNPATANATTLRNVDAASSGAGTLEAAGTNGFRVYWPSGNTGQTQGQDITGHFTASAEL